MVTIENFMNFYFATHLPILTGTNHWFSLIEKIISLDETDFHGVFKKKDIFTKDFLTAYRKR
jgi:hypothetical protein